MIGIANSIVSDASEKHDRNTFVTAGKNPSICRPTSAWIAVCIANGIHHNPAREKLDRLVKEKDVLVTSNYKN